MNDTQIVSQTADALQMAAENPELVENHGKYKNVPTFYAPSRSMLRPVPSPGITQFIEQAMTVKEVNNLLSKGKTEYKTASPKTVRRWEAAAVKRISELKK